MTVLGFQMGNTHRATAVVILRTVFGEAVGRRNAMRERPMNPVWASAFGKISWIAGRSNFFLNDYLWCFLIDLVIWAILKKKAFLANERFRIVCIL